MSFRNELGMLAVSLSLVGGCGPGSRPQPDKVTPPAVPSSEDSVRGQSPPKKPPVAPSVKVCGSDASCQSSNSNDINQPEQGPGSDFSLRLPDTASYRYKLTGFYPDARGTWRVRGFLVNQATRVHTAADGWVQYAVVDNVQHPVVGLRVAATTFALTYCSVAQAPCPQAHQNTDSDGQILGDQLAIQVPSTMDGGEVVSYTLTFGSKPQTLDLVTPSAADVVGYSFTYEAKGVPVTPLCTGKDRTAQRTLFYQSAYWHPQTFVRTVDPTAITVSCELGAIASCMSWGYKPWESTSLQGMAQTKDRWHATCVNAKTANYCGDGVAWTTYGTQITIHDPLAPAVMSEPVKFMEALWTPTGAACVNAANRRHPDLPWQTASCYATMPDCSTFDRQDYLNTGIPVPNP